MKYVMFIKDEDGDFPIKYPVIFPNDLIHEDIANAMIAGPLAGFKVRSAGVVSSFGKGEGVAGNSPTLNVTSHPEDRDIINMADYGGCYL